MRLKSSSFPPTPPCSIFSNNLNSTERSVVRMNDLKRLHSYASWKGSISAVVSNAGINYTGNEDEVSCAECLVRIKTCELPTDTLWISRHSIDCHLAKSQILQITSDHKCLTFTTYLTIYKPNRPD